MPHGLTANNDIVLVRPNLTPLGEDGLLREAAEIDEFALRRDFSKCCSISLADGNKFASIVRNPTPRGRALANKTA